MLVVLGLVLTVSVFSGNTHRANPWLDLKTWAGPTILTTLLSCQLMLLVSEDSLPTHGLQTFDLRHADTSLPGPCLLVLEMDLMLSLSALVAACQLGYAKKPIQQLTPAPSRAKTADASDTRGACGYAWGDSQLIGVTDWKLTSESAAPPAPRTTPPL